MSKYIRKSVMAMQGYVPGEQPQGGTVIKLNTNENPYPPSPKIAEAIQNIDIDSLRKYPDPVAAAVRQRVAELHGCAVENVFVGNGSDEILALCTRAFVENEGSIGYFDPSYSLYPILSEIRGVRQQAVALGDNFGWKQPAADSASLFFLTNPNAPTSMLFARADVENFCAEFQGVVLIDEAYVDFAPESLMDLALKFDNVVVMRTLSKSYSLAAMRVGYLVGNPELIAALDKIKDSYNLDGVAQTLALAALNDTGYMRANAEKIKATRSRLADELRALGFEVCQSATNFLWTIPPSGIDAQTYFEKLKQKNILIRYFSDQKISRYVRITVGTDVEIDKLLAETKEILKESDK